MRRVRLLPRPPECARPRAQRFPITPRCPRFQGLHHSERLCARGRAHSERWQCRDAPMRRRPPVKALTTLESVTSVRAFHMRRSSEKVFPALTHSARRFHFIHQPLSGGGPGRKIDRPVEPRWAGMEIRISAIAQFAENSPALQRWVGCRTSSRSPAGTKETRFISISFFRPGGTGHLWGTSCPAINGWAIFSKLSHYRISPITRLRVRPPRAVRKGSPGFSGGMLAVRKRSFGYSDHCLANRPRPFRPGKTPLPERQDPFRLSRMSLSDRKTSFCSREVRLSVPQSRLNRLKHRDLAKTAFLRSKTGPGPISPPPNGNGSSVSPEISQRFSAGNPMPEPGKSRRDERAHFIAKPLSSLRDLLPLQTSFPSHQWLGYFQQTEPIPTKHINSNSPLICHHEDCLIQCPPLFAPSRPRATVTK